MPNSVVHRMQGIRSGYHHLCGSNGNTTMPETAQLLTSQGIRFYFVAKRIDAALRRNSVITAKTNIKNLMKFLVEHPCEQTIEMFMEIDSRWHNLAKPYRYLQMYLANWGSPEDEIELVKRWFGTNPWNRALIEAFQQLVKLIEDLPDGISREYPARNLVSLIVDSGEYLSPLGKELIERTICLYGYAFDVRRYADNLYDVRLAAEQLSLADAGNRENENKSSSKPVHEKQLADIHQQFCEDVEARNFICHFEAMFNYIECCFSERSSCEDPILATIRFVVERCAPVNKRLSDLLLWVLRCRHGRIINNYISQVEAGESSTRTMRKNG